MDRSQRGDASPFCEREAFAQATALAGTQEEERGRTVQAKSSPEVQGDEQSAQQAHAADPTVITERSRAGTEVTSLQRLSSFHAPRMWHMPRREVPIRVHAPRDLKVEIQAPCRLQMVTAWDEDEAETDAAQETHIAEWEIFTKALLSVHRCIRCFCLDIRVVPQLRRRFYEGFTLRSGTAVVQIVVSASQVHGLTLFMDLYDCLWQLRNPQGTAIYGRHRANQRNRAALIDAHPELQARFLRILEWTNDMPFLDTVALKIYVVQTEPEEALSFWGVMAYQGYSERRVLTYKIDASLAQCMHCENGNSPGASTTIGVDTTTPWHRIISRRELIGSAACLVPFLVTLTHNPSPHDYQFFYWSWETSSYP